MAGKDFEPYSAGVAAGHLRPEAVQVMAEIGIDITGQLSKTVDRFAHEPFRWVVTVCEDARERCPVFHGADASIHWAVDDPAQVAGSDQERLDAFRRARDDLGERLRAFIRVAAPGMPGRSPDERGHAST